MASFFKLLAGGVGGRSPSVRERRTKMGKHGGQGTLGVEGGGFLRGSLGRGKEEKKNGWEGVEWQER